MLRVFHFVIFFILCQFICAQEEFRLERVRTIPNTATINDILVHKNQIYVATDVGLFNIDADDLETRKISHKHVDALCQTVRDDIWASIDGQYIQNMTDGTTTRYNAPGIQIRDLEYSKGKIWVASNQGIITIVTRTNEVGKISFSKKSGLPSDNISFIHVDDQKRMWIGTDKGIVFINEKDKWKTYEKKLSMEAMHYNHEGLWLVSNEEMWVIDPFNRWYPAAIDKGLRKGAIRDITADSTGRLYMASEILVRYDPYEETIESYEANTAIVSKVCTAVESDRDNRIWLGTKGGGLFLFGYADQAKTIKELMVSMEKKREEVSGNNTPIVEVAIVKADFETNDDSSSEQSTLDKTGNQNAVVGSQVAEKEDNADGSPSNAISELDSDAGVSSLSSTTEDDNNSKSVVGKPLSKTSKLSVSHNVLDEIKCSGEKANIILAVDGGAKPYAIQWNDGNENITERMLDPGSYRVEVRDSIGQIATTIVDILDKAPLELKAINKRSPSAEGRLDGNVKVGVKGGTEPYVIAWENGENGDRARRLTGGLHSITVTDANGCQLVTSIELKGAKLLPELEITRVTVGQKLEIKNIYYEADSTDLSSTSFEALDEIYGFLSENPDVKIEIGGHTNSLPPDEYCDRISEARAKSVANYLYEQGIEESRITYKGYGKRDPIASNETKEGRRRNQRVEIKIISLIK